jgi:large subunit ribosomal protein L2
MGKRIIARRRGRGGSVFTSPTHRRVADSSYPTLDEASWRTGLRGEVRGLTHDPGRGAPLALIDLHGKGSFYLPSPEGLAIGDEVALGGEAAPRIGSILALGSIPEGTLVCNVELKPGDGGKIARSSGAYCMVVAHTPAGTQLKLPSGKTVYLDDRCKATVGVIAGSGRLEKPLLKAGKNFHKMRARSGTWPRVRGQAMNAASHPFGGGRHRHPGKPTTVSRHAPPGRKVGLIAAKRTGRTKR